MIRIGALILFLIGVSNAYRALLLGGAAPSDQWSRGYLLGGQIALWLGFGVLCLVGYGLFRLRKWAYWGFLCVVSPLALLGPMWSLCLYVAFAGLLYSSRREFRWGTPGSGAGWSTVSPPLAPERRRAEDDTVQEPRARAWAALGRVAGRAFRGGSGPFFWRKAAFPVTAVLFLFLWFVWPTPYRYVVHGNESGEQFWRISRVTGAVQRYEGGKWYAPEVSPPVPADVLARLDISCSAGKQSCDVVNHSDWEIYALVFEPQWADQYRSPQIPDVTVLGDVVPGSSGELRGDLHKADFEKRAGASDVTYHSAPPPGCLYGPEGQAISAPCAMPNGTLVVSPSDVRPPPPTENPTLARVIWDPDRECDFDPNGNAISVPCTMPYGTLAVSPSDVKPQAVVTVRAYGKRRGWLWRTAH